MIETTPHDVAEWMAKEVRRKGELHQEDVAWHIKNHFGENFVYVNVNGNLAIDKKVLTEFLKLTEKDIVWVRGNRYWRLRASYDDPKKRIVE